MSDETIAAAAPLTLAMALAGVAFGFLYFAALRRTVALLAARRSWAAPLLFTGSRIGAALLFLALAATQGAAPLLAAFAGFLVARAFALRAVRRNG